MMIKKTTICYNVSKNRCWYFLYTSGATASWNTGPPSDHTTQNGYYMYIETSWPRKYGDKAWMVSRNFQAIAPGSTPCKLRFFYHMYGDSAEKLTVYIRITRMALLNKMYGAKWVHRAQRGTGQWCSCRPTKTSRFNFASHACYLPAFRLI